MTNDNVPVPIAEIPTKELLEDRSACLTDIDYCQLAILHWHTHYGGPEHNLYPVRDRLDANKKMVEIIEKELKVRNIVFVQVGE